MAVQPEHGVPSVPAGAFINSPMPPCRSALRFPVRMSSVMSGSGSRVLAAARRAQRNPSPRTT